MAVLALSVSWCVGGKENETCFPCTDRTSWSHAATRLHAAFRQGAALHVLPSVARGHPGQQLALPCHPSTEGAESLPTPPNTWERALSHFSKGRQI